MRNMQKQHATFDGTGRAHHHTDVNITVDTFRAFDTFPDHPQLESESYEIDVSTRCDKSTWIWELISMHARHDNRRWERVKHPSWLRSSLRFENIHNGGGRKSGQRPSGSSIRTQSSSSEVQTVQVEFDVDYSNNTYYRFATTLSRKFWVTTSFHTVLVYLAESSRRRWHLRICTSGTILLPFSVLRYLTAVLGSPLVMGM